MMRRKIINNDEEESSETQTCKGPSTITLTGESPFSLHQIEDIRIDYPSPSSPSSRQRSIFSRFLEMKKKNEVLKSSKYA